MKGVVCKGARPFRIPAILLVIVLMLPIVASAAENDSVLDYTVVGEHAGTKTLGELCSKKKTERAVIDYLYYDYVSGNRKYKGSGQCYGYAEKVRRMFGSSYRQKNCNVKVTKSNVYKKLKGMRPGTHVRFADKKNGGGHAHSIVLLKITKSKIYYTDANIDYRNGIGFSAYELKYIKYGVPKYLVWAREPRGKTQKVKKAAVRGGGYADGPTDGPITTLAWRPVKKAKKYVVYRSTKKSGGYKKIATVKSPTCKDKTSSPTGKVYYKVKAVTSKGKKISMSKPTAVKRVLKSPKFHQSSSTDANGVTRGTLTWSPVPGATKYKIYYADSVWSNDNLLATVSGTTYSYVDKDGKYGMIAVTAVSNRSGSESNRQVVGNLK